MINRTSAFPEADSRPPADSPPHPTKGSSSTLRGIRRAYSAAALLVFNSLVLLLLFNMACYAGLILYELLKPRPKKVDYTAVEREAYGGLSREEIQAIRREFHQSHVFEPFTMFRDRPRVGKYVNVDANGFRISRGQGPWPPAREHFNVFLFGGSTAFGWSIPDDHTVASYLQQELHSVRGKQVYLYNFGRSYYYSSQERILFEQLLLTGNVPDMAIFLDGLNDLYHLEEQPAYSSRFAALMQGQRPSVFAKWPMIRVVEEIRSRWGRGLKPDHAGPDLPGFQWSDQSGPGHDQLEAEVVRYLENKKLIEAASTTYGVLPLFVWQPMPTYKYDLKYHPYVQTGMWRLEGYSEAYERVAARSRGSSWGKNFLWCADIQQNIQKPLYVDIVHYSPEMCRLLAQCIVRQARRIHVLLAG